MGANFETSARGGSRRKRHRPKAEINVTPFVDVMLVLLIVFMLSATVLAVGVPVNLPRADAPPLTMTQEPLIVAVTSEGQYVIQDEAIDLSALGPKLEAVAAEGYDERIFVAADEVTDFGHVARAMVEIKNAGFTNVGIITDPLASG